MWYSWPFLPLLNHWNSRTFSFYSYLFVYFYPDLFMIILICSFFSWFLYFLYWFWFPACSFISIHKCIKVSVNLHIVSEQIRVNAAIMIVKRAANWPFFLPDKSRSASLYSLITSNAWPPAGCCREEGSSPSSAPFHQGRFFRFNMVSKWLGSDSWMQQVRLQLCRLRCSLVVPEGGNLLEWRSKLQKFIQLILI